MREIEVKAKVKQPDALRVALGRENIVLHDPVRQHDRVWGVAGVTGPNTRPWLRIRSETTNGKESHFFTLKRSVNGQLDSIEYETGITDPQEMKAIIEELEFSLYSDVVKTRQKGVMDDIGICLDSVDDLGDFIELEKLTQDDVDGQQVVDELWHILEGLGVDRADEVTEGYDTLMSRKLGKAWV